MADLPNIIELDFNLPVETVFSVLADPLSWQLCSFSVVDDLTQRPVSIGTTWTYRSRQYKCIRLGPPSGFSFETNNAIIDYSLTELSETTTRCQLRLTTVSGASGASHAALFREHCNLLAEQKKLLEMAPSGACVKRVVVTSRSITRGGRAPGAVHVTTETWIKRDPAEIFHLIVGSPEEFWRWMVDRPEPGGLVVSTDWPKVGSTYKYRKMNTLPFISLFKRWDTGSVRVVSMNHGRSAVLEEIQDIGKAEIVTSVRLSQSADTSAAGAEPVLLRRKYSVSIHNWFVRKVVGKDLLAIVTNLAVNETANIVALCETDLDTGNVRHEPAADVQV